MLRGDIILIIALAIIHVINSQFVVVTVQQDATVVLGEDASISCSYTIYGGGSLLGWSWANSTSGGDADTVLISSGNTPSPDSRYSVDTSQADMITLIISNTLKSDEGFYSCSVIRETNFATDIDYGELTVQLIETVTINIINSPVTKGKNVTFVCSVNVNPVSTIILYKEETEVTRETTNLIHNINSVTRSDGGNYRCEANNSVGTSTSQIELLDVQFIEVVMINISNSPVTKGKNVTFECSVNANPVSTIILYKEQTEVTREITTNLIYNISNVTKSDAGNYKCEASNIVGTSTSSQIEELDVQYSPDIILADYMNVAPGGNAIIAPMVSANPDDITYQWITDPPGIDDIDGNDATFTFNASQADGTNYIITVNATNIIGSATKSVKVTVSGVDYCVSSPCENEGICISPNFEFTCECKPGYSGKYCENEFSDEYRAACSSSTSLTIGMFFVGIIVGAFGVIAGLIGYPKIKQKAQIDKWSTDKRKQDTYMDYTADRPTAGNENQTYQDLQHREEEAAYVNVKPGKR